MRKFALAIGTLAILAAGGAAQGMRELPISPTAHQLGSTNIP
jgi:hypothetical protein